MGHDRVAPYRHARAGHQGSSLKDGVAYHDIPGYAGKTYRTSTHERAQQILDCIDVEGKYGMDIGSGPGGISIELARQGAQMTAIDHDPSALAVGQEVAEIEGLPVRFIVGNVVDAVPDLLSAEGFDFAIWFSQYMWVAKQHGRQTAARLLKFISSEIPVLFFETAKGKGDGAAGEWGPLGPIDAFLQGFYPEVEDLGPSAGNWVGRRHVYLCHS